MLTQIAVPIMKEHHLSVTTLEEYEPNREFVGRNFNGGEIIQLVLKARSGHWLPFRYVQMVMMHELAHCVQMNHSRAFWAVRNGYADQMRALWARGYTGEGLWGRGALLTTGEFEAHGAVAAGEDLPEHLCGGTYRSRRRGGKRRRRAGGPGAGDLSYQERKQRRIEKKFGKNGVALGADDEVKAALEKGKRRTQAAPRVAGSNRGRDLRAAAALARFEQQQPQPQPLTGPQEKGGSVGDESSASDEESDYEDADLGAEDALDINGKKLLDAKGNGMVKICEDENPDDEGAANELKELQSSSITKYFPRIKKEDDESSTPLRTPAGATSAAQGSRETLSTPRKQLDNSAEDQRAIAKDRRHGAARKDAALPENSGRLTTITEGTPDSKTLTTPNRAPAPRLERTTCSVCSFANESYAVTCSMCAHVLNAADVPGAWTCQNTACRDSGYLNAGDCGTCGICGQRRDVKV